jgi:hypothetical protein
VAEVIARLAISLVLTCDRGYLPRRAALVTLVLLPVLQPPAV